MEAKINKKRLKIDQLKPAAYNPRLDLQPGDPKYEQIKSSLEKNGYVDPIIWNEVTGNIVGGHQRYKILKELGAEEVDVSVVHIEDEQDEMALNIRLNKLTNNWEPIKLSELLQEMTEAGYAFGDMAFEEAEVDEIEEAARKKRSAQTPKGEDEAPDIDEVQTIVQMGDVWELGRHRMMCGDATSALDVAALMEGQVAQLIVTDPPYNVAYESADGKSIQNDSMEDAQFYTFLLNAFTNMNIYSDKGSSAYIFHADTEGLNFRKALEDAGFTLGQTCIWVKDSLVLGRSPYQWQHEPCLYAWKGTPKWYGDEQVNTVWDFPKPKKSEEHPTMKPLNLLAVPIMNSSAPDDLVIDFFGGSGSTLIACERADRRCYTMEYDPKYASVIVARFQKEAPDETIRVFRDGEWEVWE